MPSFFDHAARPVVFVTSVADLRIAGPAGQFADGMLVFQMSASSFFAWSSSSVAADNGTTVIKPTAVVGAGRWLFQATGSAVSSVFGRTGIVAAQAGDYTAAQVGAVPTARQVLAGGLVTGGGALTGDVTLTVTAGLDADIAALASSASGGASVKAARADHQHPFPTASQVGAVPTARSVVGAGLATGGGSLASDQTITVTAGLVGDIAALASSAAAGVSGRAARADHQHPFPTAANVGAVPTSRQVLGGGLVTGGGSLASDQTLTVTAGLVGDVQALAASAAAGTSIRAARADHVHPLPAIADIVGAGTYSGELIIWDGAAWSKVSTSSAFPKVVNNGLASNFTGGLWLSNTTASTGGAVVQASPSIQLTGTYWDGVNSQQGDWFIQARRYATTNATELAIAANNVLTSGVTQQALSIRYASTLTVIELFSGSNGSFLLFGAGTAGPGYIQGSEPTVLDPSSQVLYVRARQIGWVGAGVYAQLRTYSNGSTELRADNGQELLIDTTFVTYPAQSGQIVISAGYVDHSGTHIDGAHLTLNGGNGLNLGSDAAGSCTLQGGDTGLAGVPGGNAIVRAGAPGAGGVDGSAMLLDSTGTTRVQANKVGVGFNAQAPLAMPNYTTAGVTTTRTINAGTATLSDVANVLGTVVNDLISYGLFQ